MNSKSISKNNSKALRVVQVTPYYPPHLGGVEVVAQQLGEALAKLNVSVTTITSNIGQPVSKTLVQKNPTSFSDNLAVKTNSAVEFAHIPFAPGAFGSIYSELKNADVLHVHAGIAYYPEISWLAARILKKPFVVTFHCDTEPSGGFGFLLPIYNKIFLKRILCAADAVVCLAKDHVEVAQKLYGVSRNKIHIIENGVDEFFFSLDVHRGKKINNSLLFVGRLAKQKNLSRLIDAVAIIKKERNILLRIVGKGEEEEMLKEKVKRMGLEKEVLFLGPLYKTPADKKKWESIISNTDIFVLPSDYEGVPVALMEAMAAGIPAVATNVRGVKEFGHGISALVEPSSKAIAKGIMELLNNSGLRKSLASKAKQKVNKLRWSFAAKKYIDVYKKVI